MSYRKQDPYRLYLFRDFNGFRKWITPLLRELGYNRFASLLIYYEYEGPELDPLKEMCEDLLWKMSYCKNKRARRKCIWDNRSQIGDAVIKFIYQNEKPSEVDSYRIRFHLCQKIRGLWSKSDRERPAFVVA